MRIRIEFRGNVNDCESNLVRTVTDWSAKERGPFPTWRRLLFSTEERDNMAHQLLSLG